MKRFFLLSLAAIVCFIAVSQQNQQYFPPAGTWEKRSAITSGFDTAKLSLAIRFAIENESRDPRSMEQSQKNTFGKEPFGNAIGPFADRGDPTGIIIYKGYIVAEWGDPSRVDMTHSVTKSFLSTVVGLAFDKGLIKNIHDPVANYVREVKWHLTSSPSTAQKILQPFSGDHNKKINWETLLRQTSDWEGTLWDKPDWADRPDRDSTQWHNRKRNEPGAAWEYNDVRVNALALAATYVWRSPLPQVLKANIMDPIGASNTWEWHGYRNSMVVIGYTIMQSVSGGGHWGGGMFINAYDMARFGLLTLHKGNWNGRQLISQEWIRQSTTPTSVRPGYGYMNFFLNADKKYLPSAPVTAFTHVGNGTNIVYVDPEHELVMVVRWIRNNAVDGVVQRVLAAMRQ